MGKRRGRLSALAVIYLTGVAVLTLTPQRTWDGPMDIVRAALASLHEHGAAGGIGFIGVQALANIVMFVPIGAFLTVVLGARWWWAATVACVLLTLAIESAQLGIPGRVSGERDLVTNTAGGLLGALLVVASTFARRRALRLTGPALTTSLPPTLLRWASFDPVVGRALGTVAARSLVALRLPHLAPRWAAPPPQAVEPPNL